MNKVFVCVHNGQSNFSMSSRWGKYGNDFDIRVLNQVLVIYVAMRNSVLISEVLDAV